LHVENNATVKKGESMFEWDLYNSPIITNVSGTIAFNNLIENRTYRIERDEMTDVETWIVISDKQHGKNQLRPVIAINDARGEKVGHFMLPDGAILAVHQGDKVTSGQVIAKLPRAAGKTRDITGGLPRVAELFEARVPRNKAYIAPVDGLVSYDPNIIGPHKYQHVIITPPNGEAANVLVPYGTHLAVNDGDRVRAGQKISEGSVDPHDILEVLGPENVQRHLVNEIQAVYRLQGVAIADKHIECIVRQMMRKVRITDSGESELLPGEEISKTRLRTENERLRALGKAEAKYQSMLLGITKASLATDSFISAASFQESQKILTRASIEGKVDPLKGIKENMIVGRLIPCGTGARHLRDVQVTDTEAKELEERYRPRYVFDERLSFDSEAPLNNESDSPDEEESDSEA
jgi:DNA-directed RNA polymerase subunit beta'